VQRAAFHWTTPLLKARDLGWRVMLRCLRARGAEWNRLPEIVVFFFPEVRRTRGSVAESPNSEPGVCRVRAGAMSVLQ